MPAAAISRSPNTVPSITTVRPAPSHQPQRVTSVAGPQPERRSTGRKTSAQTGGQASAYTRSGMSGRMRPLLRRLPVGDRHGLPAGSLTPDGDDGRAVVRQEFPAPPAGVSRDARPHGPSAP